MNRFRELDFCLRPVTDCDLGLVRGWRNSDRVRLNMYTTHIITEAEHRAWFVRLEQSPSDQAHLFEMQGRPLGYLSFTGINRDHNRAFWAFYLGVEDAPKGMGSVMEYFALDHAFLTLGLHKLACEVLDFNASVVKLHKRFGFSEEGVFQDEILRDGSYHAVHRLALMKDQWLARRDDHRTALFEGDPPA